MKGCQLSKGLSVVSKIRITRIKANCTKVLYYRLGIVGCQRVVSCRPFALSPLRPVSPSPRLLVAVSGCQNNVACCQRVVSCLLLPRRAVVPSFLISCFLFLIGYWLFVIEYWILSPRRPIAPSPCRLVALFPSLTRSFRSI